MRTDTDPVVAGETISVGFRGMTIGTVRRRSSNIADIEFYYDTGWLGHPERFPVSILMPLAGATYEPQTVYPWFLNLLPEGSALKTVGTILRVHEQDVIGMLKEMGGDLPGALEISAAGERSRPSPRYRLLADSELADILRKLPERPLLVGEDGVHMSLAGAQEKIAVAVNRGGGIALALDGAASTHILKPTNKHFHSSVQNEAFCMRLAKATGLSAPRVQVRTVEDIEYLLVERYDRRMTTGGVERLHQEDLCQATETPPYLKYEYNANVALPGPGIKACMDALGSTTLPANKLRFFDYMLFNVLCGNVDAHAKNYSILIGPGTQVLTPIYDIMNGDIYQGVTKNLAMKIAGKQRGDHIHGRHWDRLAEENGLSPRLLRSRVARLSREALAAVPGVVAEMEASELPGPMYREIASHVERHCRNMLSNLETEPAPDDPNDLEEAPGPDEERTDYTEPVVISP